MLSWLKALLRNLVGDSIATALLGGGLALVSYGALSVLLTGALDSAADAFGGLPGDMLNILLLGGLGQILSILGSAMLTRLAITSASLGIRRRAGG
jgi:hypothetical protein